jgi:glucokinase
VSPVAPARRRVPSPARLVLAGDIGGTKSSLAMVELGARGELHPIREARFPSPSFAGLGAIIESFLGDHDRGFAAACFGVPGPVIDGVCRTTNLPWLIDANALAVQLGLPTVSLINDFVAAAYGVLALPPSALATLQQGVPVEHATKAVLGAGTGLGQAFLTWDGRCYLPHPTEGGHGGFAPQGALQSELLAALEQTGSPVVVEDVVSGPGLVRVYDFLVARGVSTSREVRLAMADEDPGAVISRFANQHNDPACQQALDLFVQAYGAEAGSMALRTLPFGGVYIAGGIAPRILPTLQRGGFIEAFCRRRRYSQLLSRLPVHVVMEPRVGLLGAALTAAGQA